MKKTLNIILFGRKKSYFVKCTLTLIGLYLGVLFWYFNVDYLGQPIQNALHLRIYFALLWECTLTIKCPELKSHLIHYYMGI